MDPNTLIEAYRSGPQKLREAVRGMTADQLDAKPIPGKWTTRQVICHGSDFAPVYVDRMKRVVAQGLPNLFSGDADRFASRLAYEARDVQEELNFIHACRQHMVPVLKALPPEDFLRTGIHSEAGAMT